jgi:four helix bundle protein
MYAGAANIISALSKTLQNPDGSVLAGSEAVGFKSLEEIVAYQVTVEFKQEVYRLLDEYPSARASRRFTEQLEDAVASAARNIAEGFGRFSMGDFSQSLRISRGSVKEAIDEIQDGIHRRYWPASACTHALALGDRSFRLITGLLKSLQPFVPPRSPIHGPNARKRARNHGRNRGQNP